MKEQPNRKGRCESIKKVLTFSMMFSMIEIMLTPHMQISEATMTTILLKGQRIR